MATLAEKDSRIKVIGQPERLGKGRGIRKAVALANGAIIGFADADNKVPIDEYDKLQPYFDNGFRYRYWFATGLNQSRIRAKAATVQAIGLQGIRRLYACHCRPQEDQRHSVRL